MVTVSKMKISLSENLKANFVLFLQNEDFRPATKIGRKLLRMTNNEFCLDLQIPNSINDLAIKYLNEGDVPKAGALLEFVLNLSIKTLGSEHPVVALCMNNFADFLMNKGQFEESRVLFKKALCICENKLGSRHPLTILVFRNMSALNCAKN